MFSFLHDKKTIEAYLRKNPALFVYQLGDLDDFFWPRTHWFGLLENGGIQALILLYAGAGEPVILAESDEGEPRAKLLELMQECLYLLPKRFYSHLSPGVVNLLKDKYFLESHGLYLKMELQDPSKVGEQDAEEAVHMKPSDCEEIVSFYNKAYPGNWFDPRMLETGCYYGIRRSGRLVSIAGVHVYSLEYRAAALGNITTLPEWRGKGLGTLVTARACQELMKTVNTIGLNVRADNVAAITVYKELGFVPVAEYEEWMVG